MGSLITRLLSKKLELKDKVEAALYRQFKKVTLNVNLGKLTHILHTHHFALVVHSQIQCKFRGREKISSCMLIECASIHDFGISDAGRYQEEKKKEVIIGILTQIDLLNYIAAMEQNNKPR